MPDITEQIPAFLREILKKEYEEDWLRIARGYVRRPVTLRANTLQSTAEEVSEGLHTLGLSFSRVAWYRDAFVLEGGEKVKIEQSALYREGKIYLQSLSSMLPPLCLAPKAGESILDMAAAPGGKTTQLAALSGGGALITACEMDKVRFERLRFNLQRQGAVRVNAMLTDSRSLSEFFRFDKILLDAPCSGSGTLVSGEETKISPKLIANCAKVQRQLLRKGLSLLKKGGRLLYSTCSVLKEENEAVIEEALAGGGVSLVPLEAAEGAPLLKGMEGTLTLCPSEKFEGFFLALLQKK